MKKVLIIDRMHDCTLPLLEQLGLQVDYRPDIRPQEVEPLLQDAYGLILRSKMKVGMELLEKAPVLRFIARAGAGVDEIDDAYLQRRGITLLNAPEGNRDAVGEHTVGMILCLLNHLLIGDKEVRRRLWRREANRGHELGTRTVGIIGYGNMGQATARRLSGFGCRVLAYDNGRLDYGDAYAQQASLEQLQAEADIVCFHIPLNKENRHMVDEAYLAAFAKPIYLVNMARGEIMRLQVLQQALEQGKVLGAALDVLENEKLDTLTPEQEQAFEALAATDRVIFMPHVGGWSFESYRRISEVLAEKIGKLV